MSRIKTFLCDLTHDTQILVSDTIPINIGLIGSYAKKVHGQSIDVELFKYPIDAISRLKIETPDIIAFSNYSWNSRLSERVARLAKTLDSKTITVFGGPNFPQTTNEKKHYLARRAEVDFYIENEAELSFSNLIGILINKPIVPKDRRPIPGVNYIDPCSRINENHFLVSGKPIPRVGTLDDLPSPYLNGMLDQFFDGRLTPFLETNRGCPFRCSFCHTGHDIYSKISRFSTDRVKAEIEYIGPRAQKLNICNLHLADTNFGMYAQDSVTCDALSAARSQFSWPTQIQATTGKNNKKKIISVTQSMGETLAVNMSVQSMSKNVLDKIQRSNISLSAYKEINAALTDQNRPTNGELIVGLPGETRESFVQGLREVTDAGVTRVVIYTLMLLWGTQFKDPNYRKTHGILGRFRLVPLNFGEYENELVFDTEEVGIQTSTLTFDDYIWCRGLSLFIEILYNNQPFKPIYKYLLQQNVKRFDFIVSLYNSYEKAPTGVTQLVKNFLKETKDELWESEEALIKHYNNPNNYRKLLDGDSGGNLIYKYKALSLSKEAQSWAAFLNSAAKDILLQGKTDYSDRKQIINEVDALCDYCIARLDSCLTSAPTSQSFQMSFQYDIENWMNEAEFDRPLRDERRVTPVVYDFYFTEHQKSERKDLFKRYGSHVNGLSKMVARVTNVENLFRATRRLGRKEIESTPLRDEMVRYSISN